MPKSYKAPIIAIFKFFELKILEDEITKDVSILVVDFAEEDEIEESKLLWENQISDLKQVLGST